MRRITTHSGYLVRLQMPLFLGYRNSFEFKYKITHARYDELIVGDTISSLIDNGFLAKQSRTATM
jgi:hypothetical protein